MTEHPSWVGWKSSLRRVCLGPGGGRWVVVVDKHAGVLLDRLCGSGELDFPVADSFAVPAGLGKVAPELATALSGLGTVTRFRNGNLWDAIATAVIRFGVSRQTAKTLYRVLCAWGEQVELADGGCVWLFPSPAAVVASSAEQFDAVVSRSCRAILQAAAAAYLERGSTWQILPPSELVAELLHTVPRMQSWIAHAAVADWSGDWALYPYHDLAVRYWARRAAPGVGWPDGEREFGALWKELAGEDLSSLTLLTVAWGSRYTSML